MAGIPDLARTCAQRSRWWHYTIKTRVAACGPLSSAFLVYRQSHGSALHADLIFSSVMPKHSAGDFGSESASQNNHTIDASPLKAVYSMIFLPIGSRFRRQIPRDGRLLKEKQAADFVDPEPARIIHSSGHTRVLSKLRHGTLSPFEGRRWKFPIHLAGAVILLAAEVDQLRSWR